MAQKKFQIKQKVNLGDSVKTAYATVVCEENEIDTLLAVMPGEITVMIEHKSVGNDNTVASYNVLERVTFKAEGRDNTSSGIYGSNGGLIVNNNIDSDAITNILVAMHPFTVDSTLKPLRSSVRPIILAGKV